MLAFYGCHFNFCYAEKCFVTFGIWGNSAKGIEWTQMSNEWSINWGLKGKLGNWADVLYQTKVNDGKGLALICLYQDLSYVYKLALLFEKRLKKCSTFDGLQLVFFVQASHLLSRPKTVLQSWLLEFPLWINKLGSEKKNEWNLTNFFFWN